VGVRDGREGFSGVLVRIRSSGAELAFKLPALLMIRGRAVVVTRERLRTFRTCVREWNKNVVGSRVNARLNASMESAPLALRHVFTLVGILELEPHKVVRAS